MTSSDIIIISKDHISLSELTQRIICGNYITKRESQVFKGIQQFLLYTSGENKFGSPFSIFPGVFLVFGLCSIAFVFFRFITTISDFSLVLIIIQVVFFT